MRLHYRHVHFGEPLEPVDQVQDIEDEEVDVWKELGGKETIARLKRIEEIN